MSVDIGAITHGLVQFMSVYARMYRSDTGPTVYHRCTDGWLPVDPNELQLSLWTVYARMYQSSKNVTLYGRCTAPCLLRGLWGLSRLLPPNCPKLYGIVTIQRCTAVASSVRRRYICRSRWGLGRVIGGRPITVRIDQSFVGVRQV